MKQLLTIALLVIMSLPLSAQTERQSVIDSLQSKVVSLEQRLKCLEVQFKFADISRNVHDLWINAYDLYSLINDEGDKLLSPKRKLTFSDFEEVNKLKEANELILKSLNQEQELFSKESQLFSFEKIKYDIPQETAENIEKMISSVDSEFSKVALAVLKNRLALRFIDEKCNKR